MKRFVFIVSAVLGIGLLASCASTKVARVSADTQIDLSGNWNDTDVRTVCDNLLKQIMASPKVKARSDQWRKAHNGDDPTVTFDDRAFRNVSSEHIDTTVVARMMQTELINASDMTFKPSGDQAAQVHKELNAQNSADSNVSQDTAAQMGQETGACYMILGTVNRMKDAIEGKAVLTYYVTCQLINVEKGTVIWQGQDDSIKKYITQASAKL